VIDDNSNQEHVKAEFEYSNVEIVQSEFPQRGELLPYYYFHKNRYFDNAVIIHDSVFIQKRIMFELFEKMNINVFPLWHFDMGKNENYHNSYRIARCLRNNNVILDKINNSTPFAQLGIANINWYGCFGVQSYINYQFLDFIQNKYKIFNMLSVIKNRSDRCCLERIMGIIFYAENPKIYKRGSIFGLILNYGTWGSNYHDYSKNKKAKKITLPIIKIFSGR